ncbi:MAG: hypothetical protein Q8M66_04495, partial [Actinomycetota bacterium]|nr:hypothetical protein [Actinomycetota bacterium]
MERSQCAIHSPDKRAVLTWLLGLALGVLAGCSSPELLVRQAALPNGAVVNDYDLSLHKTSDHSFDRIDLSAVVLKEQRPLKIDTLLLLLDLEGLKGKHYRHVRSDVYGREIVRRLHQTMPADLKIWGEVFVTTTQSIQPNVLTQVAHYYDVKRFEDALDQGRGGASLEGRSLAQALDQLTVESVRRSGRIAIVLVTSWDRIDESVENAVIRLRQRHEAAQGASVKNMDGNSWSGRPQLGQCLYAIGVGNSYSRERLYSPESCGSYLAGDAVMQPSEMASFVLNVLYGPPRDSDGDGVPDYLDHCAQTPLGRMVTS